MNKTDVCFIRTRLRGDDYFYSAMEKYRYPIMIPYQDINLLFRCMREAWFRAGLPKREWWFNKKILSQKAKYFIVKDPLMVPEFLSWLKKHRPEAKIILDYDNRIAGSVDPDKIPEGIEKWTYDGDDAERFGLHLRHGSYFDVFAFDVKQEPEIDVLYLGRDKGRAKELFAIEEKLRSMGYRTYFHICADRSFLRYRKSYYKPFMKYAEYLEYMKKSRAVLNVVQPGQTSITMREYEAAFDNVKCITNNIGIKSSDLYHPSRYFVMGEDDLGTLGDFLSQPFVPVDSQILDSYRFDAYVCQLTGMKR